MSIELPASFYIGKKYDLKNNKLTDDLLNYSARDLTTHAVIVGMTGSGKTGLGIALLEEAALDGIPALIIDPKGDLTNLLLTFPQLRPDDFLPWIEAGASAAPDGQPGVPGTESPVAAATRVAAEWKAGLAEWGIDGARIQRLRDAVDTTIYTPGSESGVPVNILDALRAPPAVGAGVQDAGGVAPPGSRPPAVGAGVQDAGGVVPLGGWEADPEDLREKIQGIVSAVLGLTGLETDPLRSREHILLSHLVEQAWRAGKDMDIEQLILGIQNPPMRKLGVFDLDTFFPPKDRFELAMALNAILAAPSFETWLKGVPFDIGSFLWTTVDGKTKPRHSIFYIAHLSDAERQFFVSLLLQQVRSWMRSQPGTSNLRALLYFDELFGYLPPYPHNPSTKTPLLYLLKNARAYGLGLVLATQNPIDLDYKALSNAGTWFIGKLQTQYDRARLIDGLETVAGESGMALNSGELSKALGALNPEPANNDTPPALDRKQLNAAMGKVAQRVFLYHNVHQAQPIVFMSRWAMSYLKGPLTRPQIRSLMAHASAQLAAAMAARAAPAVNSPDSASAAYAAQTTISVVSPDIAQYYLPPRLSEAASIRAASVPGELAAATRAASAASANVPGNGAEALQYTTRLPGASDDAAPPLQYTARLPDPWDDTAPATTAATLPAGASDDAAPATQAVTAAATPPPAQPGPAGIYQPYLLAIATITFDDRRTDMRHSVGEARLLAADQNGAPLDWLNGEVISLKAKDLQTVPPPAARFAGLPNGFANPQKLAVLQRSFVQYLYRESKLVLRRNKTLKIVENPEETVGAFRQRCAEAARAGLEAEQQKIKTKYAKLLDRLAEQLQKRQNDLTAEQKDLEGRKHEELWTNIESVAAFLGFGRAYRPLSAASRRRRQTEVTKSTIAESQDTIENLKQKLTELQKELESELQDSRAKWVAAQDALEELKLMPRKTDIHVDAFGIAWRP